MKKLQSFLIALCAATILSPAVASGSVDQQSDAADTSENRPAAKNPVTPHNHMRDGKGMSIPAKPSQAKKDAQPAVDEGETPKTAAKKKPLITKKPRPHSHPQDGKGMYVPGKE